MLLLILGVDGVFPRRMLSWRTNGGTASGAHVSWPFQCPNIDILTACRRQRAQVDLLMQ